MILSRAVAGGVLAGLAPGAAGPVLMLPALVLLWSIADRPRLAALWGLLAVLISHRWLLALHPLTWMGVPALLSLPVALAIWFVCGLSAASLLGLWSGLARWMKLNHHDETRHSSRLWPALVLALIWGLGEVLLSTTPLFWVGVGGSLLPLDPAWAGLGRWIGEGGLAVTQLLWGWWLLQLVLRRGSLRLGAAWVCSLLLLHAVGADLLVRSPSAQGSLALAAWQPMVPTREKFNSERQRRLPSVLNTALIDAAGLDVEALVAPEGTLPSSGVGSLPDQTLPLISGGFRWVDGMQRSSLLLVDPDQQRGRALLDKHRLVPLGESLPPLPAVLAGGLSAVGGLHPGDASRLMRGFFPPGAAAICYEISDGRALAAAVRSGGQWLLSIANLDPYPVQLQTQFLALARLRAIETGRDLMSVANTGPTAVVHADGQVDRLLPAGRAGVERGDLQLRSALTLYTSVGEMPLLGLLVLSLIGVAAGMSQEASVRRRGD